MNLVWSVNLELEEEGVQANLIILINDYYKFPLLELHKVCILCDPVEKQCTSECSFDVRSACWFACQSFECV